jgi:hypothetical protein
VINVGIFGDESKLNIHEGFGGNKSKLHLCVIILLEIGLMSVKNVVAWRKKFGPDSQMGEPENTPFIRGHIGMGQVHGHMWVQSKKGALIQ